MPQTFTNNTDGNLRVLGDVVEPGKSVEIEADKLPGSLRLINKGAEKADSGPKADSAPKGAEKADSGPKATTGGATSKPADKA